METIEEQSKCEEMSVSPTPSASSETAGTTAAVAATPAILLPPPPQPEHFRICLVGNVVDDKLTIEAAQTFGMPVITSETGMEIMQDTSWMTYFILNEFKGTIYDAIYNSKHRIMSPLALQQAVQMKEGLTHSSRPLYNYSMRGVITCFTGIRKKDELIRLVNLIHAMGGSIRKDMNSKVTHLICNTSEGDKYQYAMTFRLTVVRSDWVYEAWQKRDQANFRAVCEDFTKVYRLKAFEGQKICFFGFAADEHQDMVEVLKKNGGIPTDLEDPECSHVIMADQGGHFPDHISHSRTNSPSLLLTNELPENPNIIESTLKSNEILQLKRRKISTNNNTNTNNAQEQANCANTEDDEDAKVFEKTDRIVEEIDKILAKTQNESTNPPQLCKEKCKTMTPDINSTPKSSKFQIVEKYDNDGVVLTANNEHSPFLESNNISPILLSNKSTTSPSTYHKVTNIIPNSILYLDNITRIDEEDENLDISAEFKEDMKRKRDSFDDNISIISNDSLALTNNPGYLSAKKPKLIRTGSITRSLKRSMSFVAVKTPIVNTILRSRRNSMDPNASISSITSMDSTFNESIRKPVKEKLRSIRDRITKSTKRNNDVINITPKTAKLASSNLGTLKKLCNFKLTTSANQSTANTTENKQQELQTPERNSNDLTDFKTPLAPKSFHISSSASSASASTTLATASSYNRHSVCGNGIIGGISNISNNLNIINGIDEFNQIPYICGDIVPPIRKSLSTALAANNTKHYNITNATTTTNTTTAATAATATTTSNSSSNVNVACSSNAINECDISLCPTTAGEINAVVDEHFTQAKPEPKNNKTHIVKKDWFWYTIQNGYADEMDYLFEDYLDSIANTSSVDRRDSLPITFNKRKRKRFSQRLQPETSGSTPIGANKRRSSVSDACLLSVSGSFLDCTGSPDKHESGKLIPEPETAAEQQISKNKSMRYNLFMEFLYTESNYVGILDTIVNLFKNPLEEKAESSNDPLLNKSEVRAIFNNFIPIHEVHRHMLERLRELQSKWHEDCLIGHIILQHRDDLIKAYPPYVNFFEQMKETLIHCDTTNPRFHAFLKINQAKPECGRQSLQDLMIRPVQRLPSISLLLENIVKNTNKNNPDYKKLEVALKAIKEVNEHINEDKRKTEGQMAMFDIFNDIEGCPAHLVSSHRIFISKCEVTELSDTLSGRGDSLMLYLFSDTIEVCKKRSRGFNTAKSPSSIKSFKHIKLMPLSAIKFVIDICDSPKGFALNCRHNQDNKDKLYSFIIIDEEIDRGIYLRSLCKQMAENACRTDTDKALISMTSRELDVDITDANISTLSKAFKFATRTRLKVGRAFSFNKTPSKLKRAVSTMMPSPFGSTNSLTPASQLAQMRLASCTNINYLQEVSEDEQHHHSNSPKTHSEVLVAPMSVQPTRKAKTSTISMAALRRL